MVIAYYADLTIYGASSQPDQLAPARSVAGTRRWRVSKWYLAISDSACVILALVILVGVPGNGTVRYSALVVVPLVVLVAKLIGLYDRDENAVIKSTLQEVPKLLVLALVVVLGIWLADDMFLVHPATRTQAVVAGALALGLIFLGRLVTRRIFAVGTGPQRCLILAQEPSARSLENVLDHTREVVLVTVDDTAAMVSALYDPLQASWACETLRSLGVDRVILDPDEYDDSASFLQSLNTLQSSGINASLTPSSSQAIRSNLVADNVGGLTIYGVPRVGLSRSSAFVKRCFDLAASILLAIVMLPFWAVVAVLIKLDSRGPVTFRQARIGSNSKEFTIIKFRTMTVDAEARKEEIQRSLGDDAGLFKMARDPRITRVGRVLRRFSLDETPQILNVLSGKMSLVGPRPLIPTEDEMITGPYRRRLDIKPGITGPWQVAGVVRLPLDEMAQLDYQYVASWSLWEDMVLLCETGAFVLKGRNI